MSRVATFASLALHRRAGRRGAAGRFAADAGDARRRRRLPRRARPATSARRSCSRRRRARRSPRGAGGLITSESGLCLKDTRHEVGRAVDVFRFAAIEALRDDGETFAGDVSPHGRDRRAHTLQRAGAAGRGDHAVQPPAEPGRAQARAGDRRRRADRRSSRRRRRR